MERYIARFKTLEPQKAEYERRGIPQAAFEMIAAKTIYLLMAPPGEKGSTAKPGIVGVPGITVNIVECPPGNGPMLHAHMDTRESFICLKGKFEVRWGDRAEHATTLEPFDMIAVPPGTGRQFKNIDENNSLLLVIIQGDEALNDIYYAPSVAKEITSRFGAPVKEAFERIGIQFTMGV